MRTPASARLYSSTSTDRAPAADRKTEGATQAGAREYPVPPFPKGGSDTPMKQPAQPEEIARAYVFLAAPQCSSYIMGEILPIIGGYSGG